MTAFLLLSQLLVISCAFVIILDAVDIMLCVHTILSQAKAILACALNIMLDAVDILLCIHTVISEANVIVSCALIVILDAVGIIVCLHTVIISKRHYMVPLYRLPVCVSCCYAKSSLYPSQTLLRLGLS